MGHKFQGFAFKKKIFSPSLLVRAVKYLENGGTHGRCDLIYMAECL
jgi:hypothetical protein